MKKTPLVISNLIKKGPAGDGYNDGDENDALTLMLWTTSLVTLPRQLLADGRAASVVRRQ
jgi:hypothetical protein